MTFSIHPNMNNVLGHVTRGLCICCGKKANYFEDGLTKKYYERTGLCQECQKIKYEH